MDADSWVDRRRLKRHLAVWRALGILALAALALVSIARGAGDVAGRPHIAQLWIEGPIIDDERRRLALKRLAENSKARALVIRIDSPGGTVVGGEALFRQLRAVNETIPVVAVMGQLATSAGYMVALAADHIVAREGTVTGSIGVIMQTVEITEMLHSLGIKPEAIKSSPLKAAPSPLEPMTDQVRAATRELVTNMYEMFVDLVAERRAMEPARARALADGRVYTGRDAVARGLVDEIGGPDAALSWLAREKSVDPALPLIDIDPADGVRGWLDQMESLARKTVFSERLTLDGLVSLWHPGGQ